MRMYRLLFSTVLLYVLSAADVGAQILWEHKTSDIWLNPETNQRDSSICFTSMDCSGNNCTAAAIVFNYPINPIGRTAFFRSNDGGVSWFEQSDSIPLKAQVYTIGITKIQQLDSLHAYCIGDYGIVYTTSDAGKKWQRRDPPVKRELLDIHFSDPMNGILLSVGFDSIIFTTTDGGEHWLERPFHRDNIFSCHSYGNGRFSVYRYGRGPIYTTTNNFQTIDSLSYLLQIDSVKDPKNRFVFARCIFSGNDTIIAHGSYWPSDTVDFWASYAAIIRSTDGGKSWEQPWVFPTQQFARISYVSAIDRDTIFATGGSNSHYLVSTDRGGTWTVDTIITDTNYQSHETYGIELSPNGHPIAIFGFGLIPYSSILWRGEYITSSIEGIERIMYETRMYPNPTTGIVNIESIVRSKAPITVIDILGREVEKSRLSDEGKLHLDLSHLSNGLYNIVLEYYGKVFIVGKVAVAK